MISKDALETSKQNRQTESVERNEKFPGYDQVLQILEASPEMKAAIELVLKQAYKDLDGKAVSKETIAAVVFKLMADWHINQ